MKGNLIETQQKLKMRGEDCKKMVRIDKFLSVFIPDGETINSKSCEYIKHVLGLYRMFQDIALDIRSTSYNCERVSTFQARVQAFFKSFKKVSRDLHVSRKPYLHILRDHIGDYMHLWGELMDWGYGYFNCNAGEHLNKQIKSLEFDSSNLQDDRFIQVVRSFRLRQLIYPEKITLSSHEITCSACHLKGHNKKNKLCRLHPDHLKLDYSDSEDESY